MLALRAEGHAVGEPARCEVFKGARGEQAKLELVKLAAVLRSQGIRVDLAYGDRGMKGAMRAADRSGRGSPWLPAIATSTPAPWASGPVDGSPG